MLQVWRRAAGAFCVGSIVPQAVVPAPVAAPCSPATLPWRKNAISDDRATLEELYKQAESSGKLGLEPRVDVNNSIARVEARINAAYQRVPERATDIYGDDKRAERLRKEEGELKEKPREETRVIKNARTNWVENIAKIKFDLCRTQHARKAPEVRIERRSGSASSASSGGAAAQTEGMSQAAKAILSNAGARFVAAPEETLA